MKRLLSSVILALFVCAPLAASAASDKGTQTMEGKLRKEIQGHKGIAKNVQAFVTKNLMVVITQPALVKAVEEQNSKKMTLADIQAVDKKWIAAEEEMPLQKELLNNACAKELVKLSEKLKAVKEAFVTDNQGANVCMNNLTSDYWQGDEPKWQKSFKEGKGGVDVGKVNFDKSANASLQQISLPILGKGGKVIGAITIGLAVDQL